MQIDLSSAFEKLAERRTKDHEAQLDMEIKMACREAEKRTMQEYHNKHGYDTAVENERNKALKSLLDGMMSRCTNSSHRYNFNDLFHDDD